jgi:arylsulfatase A-like enzyme
MRILRSFAHGVGWLVVAVVVGGLVLIGGRWVQVKLRPGAPPAPHLEQKQEYLASIEPVDVQRAPNVVIIFFDDLGFGDLSVYGNQLISTPHIDALAEQGLRMTQFYSASPVCTPSRAALLTGRYPVRTGTHTHVFFPDEMPLGTLRRMMGYPNELPRDEITLADALGAAGYATGMIGKWHLGGRAGHLPRDFGFDSYFGVLWSNDMQPLHVFRNESIEIEDTTSPGDPLLGSFRDEEVEVIREGGVDQAGLTRLYTEEAISFIEDHRNEPFFLYLAHTFPHVPHFADPAHAGRSAGGLYGDVVEDLDRSTGAIVDAIDRLGLGPRTLIVVTSDNGADYGGHPGPLRGRKGETYEGGQRVPLVARWSGTIAPGGVRDAMAMNIDLFPTVLGLAGVAPPRDRIIDGRDLAPTWTRAQQGPHEYLFYFPVTGRRPDAVRDRRFKYLEESGDLGRSRPHLTLLDRDAENHDLRTLYPQEETRLATALEAMAEEIQENPRGWR